MTQSQYRPNPPVAIATTGVFADVGFCAPTVVAPTTVAVQGGD